MSPGATCDPGLYVEITQWLYAESAVLDRGDLEEWQHLLTSDFTYEMPVDVVRERGSREGGASVPSGSAYMYEDMESLAIRTKRLSTEFNWSEDPPSMTRRHISNVRITTVGTGEYDVEYGIIVVRSRGVEVVPEIISGLRSDRIVRVGDDLVLRSRRLVMDHAVLPARNLPFPI